MYCSQIILEKWSPRLECQFCSIKTVGSQIPSISFLYHPWAILLDVLFLCVQAAEKMTKMLGEESVLIKVTGNLHKVRLYV